MLNIARHRPSLWSHLDQNSLIELKLQRSVFIFHFDGMSLHLDTCTERQLQYDNFLGFEHGIKG